MFKTISLNEYFIIQVEKLMTVVCTNNTHATLKIWRESLLGIYWEVSSRYLTLPGKFAGKRIKVKVKMLWLKC